MKNLALKSIFILSSILIIGHSNAQVTFQRTYGGAADDQAYSVDACSDGGYIMAGYTKSYGEGGKDVYVVKTDSLGEMEWSKTYGGANDDQANVIKETN